MNATDTHLHTFPKAEKLCGQLRIKALYSDGQRFVAWPMRVTYKRIMPDAQASEPQVLIWAPKSIFKHAVDRNHMRRLMREAYRLHKDPLQGMNIQIAFNYIDREQQPYDVIEKAMLKAIRKINTELKNHDQPTC